MSFFIYLENIKGFKIVLYVVKPERKQLRFIANFQIPKIIFLGFHEYIWHACFE